MPEPFLYPSFLDLVAVELGRDPQQLRAAVAANPSICENQLQSELLQSPLARAQATLDRPLFLPDSSTPLLAESSQLEGKYLGKLLARQAGDPTAVLGPIGLLPSPALLQHYQQLVQQRLQTILDNARNGSCATSRLVAQLLQQCKRATLVEACSDEILPALAAQDALLPDLLLITSRPDGCAALLRGIFAARVAMAVLGDFQRFPDPADRKRKFLDLGQAAFLQDISLLLHPDTEPDEHAKQSSQLLLRAGFGLAVAGPVRDHHKTKTSSDVPILLSKKTLAAPTRVLVACNTFLGLLGDAPGSDGFEAMKRLQFLANQHYLDKGAVDILCNLYLPKAKNFILRRTNQICHHCLRDPSAPVLWPISGDKVPSVFLCNHTECSMISEQLNYIAQNIPFEIDGEKITTLRKGSYYICPLLSEKIKELYRLIEQSKRG